jgi:gamma-glutamyltranspeptidase/glutathione hydrolase
MPPPTTHVLGSDPDVTAVGAALLPRGNAVDAVVGAVFAASALHASVLLGPVQLLVGGAGAGLRAIDGRNRQPGLGNPRPRGFLPSEPIPAAAKVGVPALPAALLAAVTTYGKLSVAAALAPAFELARGKAPLRAGVLERIAQRGPAALAEAFVADELVAAAGRLAGGLLSARDLDELRPEVTAAASTPLGARGRDVITVPWGAEAVRDGGAPIGASAVRVVVAVDRNGLLAACCYEVAAAADCLAIDAFELAAPFTAVPVRRGQPRVKAGQPRPAAAPIALGKSAGILDLTVGLGGSEFSEAMLRTWLEAYRPLSELERQGALPEGLLAIQRAGSAWAAMAGS